MRNWISLALVAALIGGIMGLITPSASAAMSMKMIFAPPSLVQNKTAYMSTGWHKYGEDPYGLDWQWISSPTDVSSYVRGWAYHSDTSNPAIRTKLDVRAEGWFNCANSTRVDIYSKATNSLIGTYWLVHSKKWLTSNGRELYHSSSESWFNWQVADMIEFKDTCSWTGPHIHEVYDHRVGTGTWSKNESFPYSPDSKYYPCPPYSTSASSCPYSNTSRSNWTYELTWSE